MLNEFCCEISMFKNLIQIKNEIMLQNTVTNDSVLAWGEWQGRGQSSFRKTHI